jgi:diguanylate cyclase (GGDEF)-like protein
MTGRMSRYDLVHRRYLALAVVAALVMTSALLSAWWVVRDARAAMELQVRVAQGMAASERAAALGDAIDTAVNRLRVVASGPGVAPFLRDQSPARLVAAVENALSGPVTGAAVTDATGVVLATSGRMPDLAAAGRPVFRSSANRDAAYMTIRAAAHDESGKLIGWCYQDLSLRQLSPQFSQPFPKFAGATSLIARDGTVVMTTMNVTLARVQAPELAAMVASGSPASGSYDSSALRTRRLAAVHPVEGTDLVVLVSANAKAASEPAAALVGRVVVLFLIAVAIIGTLIAVAIVLLGSIRRQLIAAREVAAKLAQTDPLTLVGNRRAFDDTVSELMEQDDEIGLVVIDLDDLKLLNDTCGHAAGDDALRRSAAAIASAVRPNDLVSRVGGDEFVILLTQGGLNRADDLAARVRVAVAEIDIPGFGRLSVSTGVDVCPGRDLVFGLNRADEMLYQAKRMRSGRADAGAGRLSTPVDQTTSLTTDW